MKYLLLRNSTHEVSYQNLRSMAAVEPPIWMMYREQDLKKQGHDVFVFDNELECLKTYELLIKINDIKPECVEIFPTGNHPSAFYQQREGLDVLVKHIGDICKNVSIVYDLSCFENDICTLETCWDSFNLLEYRAHNWHCDWGLKDVNSYATLSTALGCPFSCNFCAIHKFFNLKYKEKDLQIVYRDIDKLAVLGVKNIKIMDELFFFNPSRVENICNHIIKNQYKFNIWAYARIDTINERLLPIIKKAGINWLGIGIESGDEQIRKESLKGKFNNDKIREIIEKIKQNDIKIGGNFIFGFPDDNIETMQKTLDFALELQCEFANLYCMMAYPDSELYELAKQNEWDVPEDWSSYSQYSYNCLPLRTKHLTSAEVLRFRDDAFFKYYENEDFLNMIEKKMGKASREYIESMSKKKIRRKLLEKK